MWGISVLTSPTTILETDEALLVPDALFTELAIAPRGVRFPDGLWWTEAIK